MILHTLQLQRGARGRCLTCLSLKTPLYITLTMILYENMKPIEHVLLHRICVRSHLMCALNTANAKLSLYCIIEHIEVADEFITSKNVDFTRFFIIKPRHTGQLKKQIWVEKTLSGSPSNMRQNACYRNLRRTFEDLLPCYCYAIKIKGRLQQSACIFRNLTLQQCTHF